MYKNRSVQERGDPRIIPPLRNRPGLHRSPPELWPQLGGGEVRGPTFAAVSAAVADTAAVAVPAGAADSAAVSAGAADEVSHSQQNTTTYGSVLFRLTDCTPG